MKLNTGKVAFPIDFDNGDKDCIYFNPNDPDLSIRMRDFQKNAQKRIEEIGDIQLNNNGEPTEEQGLEIVSKYEKIKEILFEELDRAFNSSISNVVFKHCSPFAIVNGNYFVLQFIEAITPEIEKNIISARNEIDDRIKKHINKYIK